ncbi:transmembrane proteins 14C-domain-containing protein [Hyaloscypha finlandica]|nr:transmembrane proteins 14C-domain-containing protein [Hyaloscypha finlandica]
MVSILCGIETPAFILGALTAGGGTFGYIKTGSVPSIAAGVTVGVLYLIGGYRIQTKQTYGVELALLASVVLAGSSIPRALKSQKPLPTGLSLLALYGLYTFGNAFRQKL